MQCLTATESREWLALSGAKLDENRNIVFSYSKGDREHRLAVDLPKTPVALSYFAARLADWLPDAEQRMLWLSNWDTYPPDHITFFDKLRRGYGEERPLIEAPGHLFSWDAATVYEPSSEMPPATRDHAAISGLVLLVMCYGWEGYLVARGHNDHIFLGDARIVFASARRQRIEDTANLANTFKLAVMS